MKRILSVSGLAVAIFVTAPVGTQADEELHNKVLPRATFVETKLDVGGIYGSGVLIDDSSKLMVTNAHVVKDRKTVNVYFPSFENGKVITEHSYYKKNADKLAIRGKVLRTAPKLDLAVVQLERLPQGVEALPLAYFSAKPGQEVFAIGNSGVKNGKLWNYREGRVRRVSRAQMSGQGMTLNVRLLESALASDHGDSGGPMFNERGQLVGVVSMKAEGSKTLAVDIDDVWKIVQAR